MKVLHLLQSRHFSGAENMVCQIIELFRDEENIEMLYCSRDGKIREALIERNIPFASIKELSIKEVRRIIKEYKPDVIHAHDMRASFIGAVAGKNIPLICHIHNNSFASRGISLKSLAFIYAACKAKKIFWVSDSAFLGYLFHDLFKKKSDVIYNIINMDLIYQKMREDNNSYNYDVVFLGRLSEPKNPIRLMNVFKRMTEIKSDIKIVVIGTGELESLTLEEAERLNIKKNVTFLGFQSNPYKILHDSKVMVMTSLWEGTPMCVLEALGLGVPIIGTPVDGLKTIIKDGYNGYLSDDDETIAKECVELVCNDDKRNKLSKNCAIVSNKWNNKCIYKNRILKGYINATN